MKNDKVSLALIQFLRKEHENLKVYIWITCILERPFPDQQLGAKSLEVCSRIQNWKTIFDGSIEVRK